MTTNYDLTNPALTDEEARTWARTKIAADFFFATDKGLPKWTEPKVIDLAGAVLTMGPVAPGADDRFWTYRDNRWAPDDGAVQRRLVSLLGQRYRPALVRPVRDAIDAISPYGVIDAAQPDSALVGFCNGLLDVTTWEVLPADPYRGFVPRLAVDYDSGAQCPNFQAWLAEVLAPEDVNLAWCIIAYMLVTGNPWQKAIMFIGLGSNGKSTFIRVLNAILGPDNYSAVSLGHLTSNRFAPATLYGKLANICGDIDPTHLRETAMFKMLVGGDPIYAEHKNKDGFKFTSYAVPLFSANEIPTTSDTSDAYFRRWIALEFPHKLSGRFDETKLTGEAAGIAAYALRFLPDVLANGIVPNAVTQEKFEIASDPLRLFYAEECVADTDAFTSRNTLYATYEAWAKCGGSVALSNRKVFSRLRALGVKDAQKHDGERGFALQVRTHAVRQPW